MKLGLVLEGGGMKCAYTAAILDRMMDDQVKPDYVIGVSAGCACGASFLAGQRDRNRRFFVDHVQDPEYLGLQAWKSSGSVFNLRRIYQDYTAEGGIDPLDYDAMVKNPAEWWAVATDVETGKPHYFTKEDVSATDYSAIMASCSIPVVCRPIEVCGRKYCDGGCSNSLPVQHALEAGCDKVIVILCRPKDSVREPEKMRFAYRTVLRNYPNLVHSIEMRHIRYNRQLRATRRLEEEGHAFIFAPHEPIHVSTYTKDPGVLQGIYDTGLKEYEEDRSRFETFLKKQLTVENV